MNNPYTGVVEAILRKSQLLLDAAGDKAPLLTEGLQEAVLIQLWRAYRGFLVEQACQLGLSDDPQCARDLFQLTSAQGSSSAELGELLGLQEDDSSWLSAMEAAWGSLWQFSNGSMPRAKRQDWQAQLIPLREMVGAQPVLTWEILHFWQRALTELIHRQRAQAQEW
ncbi:MAG: hypothetical protein K0U59_07185 [Gammaproteobacteria bacterium]|nr:hypothetical protein [Gammaproteobacteria bacterium]